MADDSSTLTRRNFLCSLAVAHGAVAESTVRPNIVIIMADDMGFSDLGCYGSEIATPNLDGLAARGIRFTQFYNTARCCPTRSSLLTGLYAHQAGVGYMAYDRGYPAYQGYLNERCVTLAEVLGQGGYRTLMSGKWHVGDNRPHWPLDRGFHRYFGLVNGGSNYFRLSPGRKLVLDNEPFTPSGENFYMTDALTDYAVKFLDEQRNRPEPFFLYLAYTAPHYPLHALPADIAKYRGKYMIGWDELRRRRHRLLIRKGIIDPRWALTPRDPAAAAWEDVTGKDLQDLRMAVYAAQIDRMDQNIGRVLSKLRAMGAEENTLVMFLADNGGCAEVVNRGAPGALPGTADSYTSYGLPWANASNTPFRLYKRWVHEGGISTPFIACWPRVIHQPGRITHQPGHVIDLMATCLDVAGIKYPHTYNGRKITPLEGASLLPVLRGGMRKPHHAMYWEHLGNCAIRQGKWKLVSRHPERWELFDLESDRTEMNNLAARRPDLVRALARRYGDWAKRCGVVPYDILRRTSTDAPKRI